ncbi:MAG: helix-turn-helix domain-containing protein [Rectinemataceae bacterium]
MPKAKRGDSAPNSEGPRKTDGEESGICSPAQAQGRDSEQGAEFRLGMSNEGFGRARALLGRSQRELADILGISRKAVESYEQGWRKVPGNVERLLYFLLFKLNESKLGTEDPCWISTSCSEEKREACVAFLAHEGHFCWFFTGKLCATSRTGEADCHACAVFSRLYSRIAAAPGRD